MPSIHPDPTQPRRTLDDASVQELANSIRQVGILQPITVREVAGGRYQIITGERRYRAALLTGLKEMPCWIQTPAREQILIRQIVENWQRAELHPFDLADALAALRDANGHSQRQLAEATGKSEGEISKFLKLLELEPAAQKEAREDRSGRLSRRHLYAIGKLDGDEAGQREMINTIRSQHLSAAETEKLVESKIAEDRGTRKRGAPVTNVRYVTTHATVVVRFRRQKVAPSDIVEALDEARRKAQGEVDTINIVRAK